MYFSISGKFATLKAGAIPSLLKLVNASESEARLYAIKTLTMLAEAPAGRQVLEDYVSDIQKREQLETSPSIINAIKIAVKVITWKP